MCRHLCLSVCVFFFPSEPQRIPVIFNESNFPIKMSFSFGFLTEGSSILDRHSVRKDVVFEVASGYFSA